MTTRRRPLAALTCLLAALAFATAAKAHFDNPVFIASNDRSTVLAFLCKDKTFTVLLTDRPDFQPWNNKARLRPTNAWNIIRWHIQKGPSFDTGWYHAYGFRRTWMRPNAKRWTQALAYLHARGEPLTLTLYPPANPPQSNVQTFDFTNKPIIPIAWALAATCG